MCIIGVDLIFSQVSNSHNSWFPVVDHCQKCKAKMFCKIAYCWLTGPVTTIYAIKFVNCREQISSKMDKKFLLLYYWYLRSTDKVYFLKNPDCLVEPPWCWQCWSPRIGWRGRTAGCRTARYWPPPLPPPYENQYHYAREPAYRGKIFLVFYWLIN